MQKEGWNRTHNLLPVKCGEYKFPPVYCPFLLTMLKMLKSLKGFVWFGSKPNWFHVVYIRSQTTRFQSFTTAAFFFVLIKKYSGYF